MMGKGFIRYKIKSFIIERGDFRNKLTSGVYKKMLSPQKLFFKSLVPEVSSNDNIQDLIGYALAYQEYFERNVFPYDEETFKNDVCNFVIESEKIDRLYYIFSYEEDYRYELNCRMLYRDIPYYVLMSAYCGGCGWGDCR